MAVPRVPRKASACLVGSLCTAALALSAALAAEPRATVTGITVPEGYRSWVVLAPSHRTDKDQLRLILGNAAAAKAAREHTLPYPDGAILAKLTYKAQRSEEWAEAIVPGAPATIEFMVKDAAKYAATGGWGFGRFSAAGEPLGDAALYETCFPCHEANVVGNDFVFTRWAP